MDRFKIIDDMLKSQTKTLEELNREIGELKKEDVWIQNEQLLKALKDAQAEALENSNEIERLKKENGRLKNALFQHVYDKKRLHVNDTKAKILGYFNKSQESYKKRLDDFEVSMDKLLGHITSILCNENMQIQQKTHDSIIKIEKQAKEVISEARREAKVQQNQAEKVWKENEELVSETLSSIENEPIKDVSAPATPRWSHLSGFLGMNILGKLGMLLIVFGVIAGLRFTYNYITDPLKALLAFIFGLSILVLGEFQNRRKPDTFSIVLTSGGIAILYAATAMSLFFLKIMPMPMAMFLCVLITIISFILSRRYDAQAIAAFAIAGGYLPMFSILIADVWIYGLMAYFLILNAFALVISIYKKWHISQYISFFLNIVAEVLVLNMLYPGNSQGGKAAAIVYPILSIILYMAIPLIYNIKLSKKVSFPSYILLIFNIVFGAIILFITLYTFELWSIAGIFSIVLCVLYIAVGRLLEKKLPDENTCQILFYITGLSFAVLTVPIQLDIAYLSLGWLVQGTALLCYGIWSQRKFFIKAGGVIYGLCIVVFVFFDFFIQSILQSQLFFYKYFFVTLSSICIITMMNIKKKTDATSKLYEGIVSVNNWFFILFACNEKLFPIIFKGVKSFDVSLYFNNLCGIIFSICYAYLLAKIKTLNRSANRVISVVIYVVSVLWVMSNNFTNKVLYRWDAKIFVLVLGAFMILLVNILAVFALRDILTVLMKKRKLEPIWYPLILSGFFVFILLQNLIIAMNLSISSVIITAVLAITALGWTVFGFTRYSAQLRMSGLILSCLSVLKLFLVDASYLTAGIRIISYFIMGAILLGISFVYQYFSKRLENEGGRK